MHKRPRSSNNNFTLLNIELLMQRTVFSSLRTPYCIGFAILDLIYLQNIDSFRMSLAGSARNYALRNMPQFLVNFSLNMRDESEVNSKFFFHS